MPEPPGPDRRIEVSLRGIIIIRGLEIPKQAVADYLRDIPADKREIAFIHALELGIAELTARRKRAAR